MGWCVCAQFRPASSFLEARECPSLEEELAKLLRPRVLAWDLSLREMGECYTWILRPGGERGRSSELVLQEREPYALCTQMRLWVVHL
jgi:hypothetical protein